jgi:hypothetical protein
MMLAFFVLSYWTALLIGNCDATESISASEAAPSSQQSHTQHDAFLPPLDSPAAVLARAIYDDYFRGGLTLSGAMMRIGQIDFSDGESQGTSEGGEMDETKNNIVREENKSRQPKRVQPGELYAKSVVALMAEHFYFAASLTIATTQGTSSASHHRGSSAANSQQQFQQQSSFSPPKKEKVILVLSLFREARDMATIGTPTHHFLSVKLFRLLLFLDRCAEALQLAERYVARAKKTKRMLGLFNDWIYSFGS